MTSDEQKYTDLLAVLGLDAQDLSPSRVNALQVLASGAVPAHQVRERDARGGKRLKYVPHTWVRELLRDGLGLGYYSLEVLSTEYHSGAGGGESGSSASALVRLTVYTKDGCSKVTEPGVFDNTMKLNPSAARGAAASRALCRCVMQMFGLGAEFYETEEKEMSASAAWASIKAQAAALGLEEEAVKAKLQGLGIAGNALGRQYAEAMQAVQEMADNAVLADPVEPDLVIDAAKELGAEVTHAEADMEAALDENGTASDALANTVAEVTNWGEFYDVLGTTMQYPNGTAVQGDINAIFGPTRPQKDGKPDFVKMYNALREWKDATDDKAKDAVIKKYNA